MRYLHVVSLVIFATWLWVSPLWAQGFGVFGQGRHLRDSNGPGATRMGVSLIAPKKHVKSWFFRDFYRGRGNKFLARTTRYSPCFPMSYGWACRVLRKNYSSAYFVQKWKDRDPLVKSGDESIGRSALLSKGMNQTNVMGRLGAPMQRIRLEHRELWEYSSYGLLFESGALVEIR